MHPAVMSSPSLLSSNSTSSSSQLTDIFPPVHQHTGWQRSFFNGQICIGLKHPPNASPADSSNSSSSRSRPPHWLIYLRFNNVLTHYLSSTVNSSMATSTNIVDRLGRYLPAPAQKQMEQTLQPYIDHMQNSDVWMSKLWHAASHNPAVSVLDKLTRHSQYKPAADLTAYVGPQYDITYSKKLWCAGQGTLHMTTLTRQQPSSNAQNSVSRVNSTDANDELHELSFEFDASAVDGAGELIDSNISWPQKQRRLITLLAGAARNIPIPMVDTLVNAAQSRLLQMVDDTDNN